MRDGRDVGCLRGIKGFRGPVKGVEKMKKVLVVFIRLYQYIISPFLPQSCRYVPTCSEYAKEAVLKYGVLKGGWMSVKRIARCHPFSEGGSDPVV